MDFRRIPFQFTSTDPAKRQAELQKRFGLPVNKEKMHIDFANPDLMGIRPDGMSSATNSPRLQHRVPLFKEGFPEPMKSSVDSQGSPVAVRKPHVRVVPIEIESDDNSTKRNRNLSGPTVEDHPLKNGTSWLPEEFAPCARPSVPDPKPNEPRERTIPIQVEGTCQSKKAKTVPVKKEKSAIPKKEASPKQNGFSPMKVDKPSSQPKKPPAWPLKKIDSVLEKLKTYHADVEKFTGTIKEKRYRYLDEMLTRLILELDDVDTTGNEEVRLARKAAVKQVQASVDLLEAKVTGRASEKLAEEPVIEQDVEMGVPSSQEENADMPDSDENKSRVVEEPTSTIVNQAEKIQDVEMKDGKILQEVSNEVKESKESPVMEIDVDSKPIESENVVIINSSTEESTCSEVVNNVVTDMKMEDVSSESGKESELILLPYGPVVSLAVSSTTGNSFEDNVINGEVPTFDEKATELQMESGVLLNTTDCVEELVTKSCHVDASGKNISNSEHCTLIPNGHSTNISTEHSSQVLN